MQGKDAYQAMLQFKQRFAEGGEATASPGVSDQAIREYLQTNPTMTDRQIAAKMDEFGVSTQQMARATGLGQQEVDTRYQATKARPEDVAADVREALQSSRLTRDQYATLSNYFGNPLTTAELTSADAPTIRDFVNKPRTGFEFASFLATRGPRHGGNNPYGMTLYENLLQPYLNTVQTQFQPGDSEGGSASIIDPITGQYRSVINVGDNRYRAEYSPVFSGPSGSGEMRTAVGLDYVVDPNTGRATLVSPYLQEFQPSRNNFDRNLLSLAAMGAGMYFFPGMNLGSIINRTALSGAAQAVGQNLAEGGEVTKFVKRQSGSPEEGEVAQQMTVGTLPGIMAQASEEPGVVRAKTIEGPATRSAQALQAYLQASIPDVKVMENPALGKLNRSAQVDMTVPNIIQIDPRHQNKHREAVLLHEAEHSRVGKAMQGVPEEEQYDNDIRFDRLYGDKGGTRSRIVRNFVDNKDKIEKFFGVNIPDVYFDQLMYKNQSRFGSAGALFEEQIATLSALEQLTNKSITKGMPELFPDDKAAAIYDAITGLRQTRLDARDLPPFTPQYKSGMDWIKEKLRMRADGSPEEGEVAQPELKATPQNRI